MNKRTPSKYSLIKLLLVSVILTFSCKDKNDAGMFPSDHLFMQRSFPYGKIDVNAYKEAQEFRLKKIISSKERDTDDWESIGPYNASGRITDIEVHPFIDDIVYAGSASGGIFKSMDSGNNWEPIFDNSQSLSIGDIAIYGKDPEIIYVGTGEANAGGGSLAYDGLGMYRSDNGGESWTSLGPDNVGSIGRLAIDPNDPDKVYAACMGQLFENNPERGVYRTSDGGSSWEHVLFVNDSTGAIDLAIHPQNGNVIYAAMWQRVRKVYDRQYGGEGSGIFRSMDGGENWIELNNGLPVQGNEKGRIGLAISESDPHVLYAYYADAFGWIRGIYRTEDGGDSWEQRSHQGINNLSFMWWFGKIFVHPTDPDSVYATSLNMFGSGDGAESWMQIFQTVHVDQHALSFSRQDPSKVYNGNDGGVYLSSNAGMDIPQYMTGMANHQFYTCTIDPVDPNVIYGGAQDNGILVTRDDSGNWDKIFGGDGFRILVDPLDNQQIYFESQNGNIWASENGGEDRYFAASGVTGLFNWNTPLEMDTEDPSILYTGTQSLFRSQDKGNSWESISPRLVNTDNPPGMLSYGTLTYIEVSPHDPDHIYVGTDDGNVWRSLDFGSSFDNISDQLPKRWVTSIATDPWNESGVYLCMSGFRYGDSDSQIFYSDDYGANWVDVASNLPDIPVNDIVVDDLIRGTLYVATDVGVYYTEDGGDSWDILGSTIPNVPVIDLDYHMQSRALVAASYGRGMYRIDLGVPSNTHEEWIDDLSIYPNPANDRLHILSSQLVNRIEIYDMSGKLLRTKEADNSIDITNLNTGTYMVKLWSKDKFAVRKCLIFQ